MRALLVVALVACGGKKDERELSPPPPPRDGGVMVDAAPDWKPKCKAALIAAATAPIARRPREIIDGCQPCGDLSALLRWDIRSDEGGPSRVAIEEAMERCSAYCTPAAKQRFLGTLDDARGKRVRTPWRFLGELCGEAVSAKPDARFMSAPYFALDRIGRAAALDRELAKLMTAVELPLPPVATSGDGFTLPLAPVTKPETGRVQVTVAATVQHVGLFARARLVGTGVFVDHGGDPYPGTQVGTKELAAALDKLEPGVVTIVAPMGLPARRIADVVVGKRAFVLAAEIRAAPHGWSLLGHVPVELVAGARSTTVIVVTDAKSVDASIERLKKSPPEGAITLAIAHGSATVNDLAKLLGALAYLGRPRVVVVTT